MPRRPPEIVICSPSAERLRASWMYGASTSRLIGPCIRRHKPAPNTRINAAASAPSHTRRRWAPRPTRAAGARRDRPELPDASVDAWRPASGQFLWPRRARGMKLLSHISPDGLGLPEPADARRLALGFEAWREALALSEGDPAFDLARSWSAADSGKRLLASIFGNSPFLSSVAVKEWAFLTRLLDEGADPLFSETAD